MDLFRDLRFAARLLLKDRWFTLMAVVVLALGIGANNAVFTIVNAVLSSAACRCRNQNISSSSAPGSDRGHDLGVSLLDFQDWQRSARTLSAMSFVFSGSFNVGNEGLTPDLIPGCYVSANFFKMLGVPPARGRDFIPAEDTAGSALVVMISDTLWRHRYGGDAGIVGKTIRIGDVPGASTSASCRKTCTFRSTRISGFRRARCLPRFFSSHGRREATLPRAASPTA